MAAISHGARAATRVTSYNIVSWESKRTVLGGMAQEGRRIWWHALPQFPNRSQAWLSPRSTLHPLPGPQASLVRKFNICCSVPVSSQCWDPMLIGAGLSTSKEHQMLLNALFRDRLYKAFLSIIYDNSAQREGKLKHIFSLGWDYLFKKKLWRRTPGSPTLSWQSWLNSFLLILKPIH